MNCRHLICVGCVAGLLAACNPTFNWRERPIGNTALATMFPCKPEMQTRTLPIAGSPQEMAMHSCDAGGATFAVAHAKLADPAQVPEVLTGWRQSTLSGLRADPASVSLDTPQSMTALPQVLALQAARRATDRQGVVLRAVWFASGMDVFAAFVMAPTLPADAIDVFFTGLRLR